MKYGKYEERFREIQKRTGKRVGMLEEKPVLNLVESMIWNIFLKLHNRRGELTPIKHLDLIAFFEMEGYRDREVKALIKNAIFVIDNHYIKSEVEQQSREVKTDA